MKALSLNQPYASLIAWGEKRFETRSWPTNMRGTIAIHASASVPAWARAAGETEEFRHAYKRNDALGWRSLPRAAILCVADLVDCIPTDDTSPGGRLVTALKAVHGPHVKDKDTRLAREMYFGNYEPKRYAWRLDNVRVLPRPIECKGALGLWTVPASSESAINLELEAA